MAGTSGGNSGVAILLAGAVLMASAGGFILLTGRPAEEVGGTPSAAPVGSARQSASPPSSAEGQPPLPSADISDTNAWEPPAVPAVAWQVPPFTEFYAKGGTATERPVPPARPAAPIVEITEFERARQTEQAAAKAAAAAETEQRKPRPLGDFFKK